MQNKFLRICLVDKLLFLVQVEILDLTNEKVDLVLADETKYKLLSSDMAVPYQRNIESWYISSKSLLKSIPEDIAKLSPSPNPTQLGAELVIFLNNPATQPTTHLCKC